MQTSTENNRLAQRSLFDMAVILLLIVLSLLVIWLSLTHRTHGSAHWPGYSDLLKGLPAPSAWLRWVLGGGMYLPSSCGNAPGLDWPVRPWPLPRT